MGTAGLKDEGVTRLDGRGAVRIAHLAGARDHLVELPLGAVRMVGARGLSRGNTAYLHVEGLPLHEVRRVRDAAEHDRDVSVRRGELPLRRCRRLLRYVPC